MLESPFFLLYGRDPRLPTPDALTPKVTRKTTNLKEYGVELHSCMSEAWSLARVHINRAQKRQKGVYDQSSRGSNFQGGERVFLYKPAEQTGAKRKFARPFHGPYRLVEVGTNTAKIRPVDRPAEEPILVALNRCPDEVGDTFWPSRPIRSRGKNISGAATNSTVPQQSEPIIGCDNPSPTEEIGGTAEMTLPFGSEQVGNSAVLGDSDQFLASGGGVLQGTRLLSARENLACPTLKGDLKMLLLMVQLLLYLPGVLGTGLRRRTRANVRTPPHNKKT